MEIRGKRILVVEDDHFIGDELCENLRAEGAVVLGPAPTAFYAMQLLGRRGVDGAILDTKLHGKTVFGLADELVSRGTPIIFATDYGDDAIPERHSRRPRLTKPYRREELMGYLEAIGTSRASDDDPPSLFDTEGPHKEIFPLDSPQNRMARAISSLLRRNAAEQRALARP